MRKSPRERRLLSDYKAIQKLDRESSIFSFSGVGNPPERYRVYFRGAGFCKRADGYIVARDQHEVVIDLGAAYPRMIPNLAWQTPVFHPNISNNGVVCLGGYGTHWVPSLTLDELCTMLWEMIRYRNFDTESPYNREAAAWAKTQSTFTFPIDPRPIRNLVSDGSVPADMSLPNLSAPAETPTEEVIESGIEIIERPNSTPPPQPDIIFRD